MITTQEVVHEIRDRKTRTKLESGVFELHLRSPSPEALKRTVEFCKATGDYGALSAVDIKVIALAVSVEMEKNGTKYLKDTPTMPKFEQPNSTPVEPKQSDFFNKDYNKTQDNENDDKTQDTEVIKNESEVINTVENHQVDAESNEIENKTDLNEEIIEDDEDGWITPDNFTEVILHAEKPDEDDGDRIFVACCTTDFAVQVSKKIYF